MRNTNKTPKDGAGKLRVNQARQLGEIVRGRRKARGLSQQTLAEKLGISQGRVSALETDPAALPLDRLLLLLKILGLDLYVQETSKGGASPAEW